MGGFSLRFKNPRTYRFMIDESGHCSISGRSASFLLVPTVVTLPLALTPRPYSLLGTSNPHSLTFP
jgi:hypothetical protein